MVEVISVMVKIFFWGEGLKFFYGGLDFSRKRARGFFKGVKKISEWVKDFFRGTEIFQLVEVEALSWW